MATLSPGTVALLVLLPLIVWRMYARFRRLVGRQRLSRIRPWITVTVFPALVLLVGWVAHFHIERLAWLAMGIALGVLCAVYALRLTRFEATPQGLFYTPNAHLGIALSLLMLARIGYRMYEVMSAGPILARDNSEFVRSPITLVIFGVLAGYYVAYATGLMRWRFAVLRAKREREAAQQAQPE